jgi:plasmid replication initiation protein
VYILGGCCFLGCTKKVLRVSSLNNSSLESINTDNKKQTYLKPLTLGEGIEAIHGITISKSNKIIEAQNRLNTREQKVLAACLALINPLGEYPNGITVELTDQQLEGLTGIKKKNLYDFIEKAAKNYHSIPIETPGKKKGTVDYINIAHRSTYDPEERKFTITFHSEMEEHLIELVRYTRYELQYLVKLSTKYAMRLYELICMTYNLKKGGVQYWRVPLEDLYFPLGLTDITGKAEVQSYIDSYSSFRRRVLEPSIAQINKKTNFRLHYGTYKRGKVIAGITFQIARQSVPEVLTLDEQGSLEEQLVALGIANTTVKRWIDRHGRDRIQSNLRIYQNRIELGQTITNPAAYLNFLVTNNVAELPDVANPYSVRYKNNKHLREFVSRILVPIWWDLDEVLRYSLAENDVSLKTHVITSNDIDDFIAIAKSSSVDEAEALIDRETIKFDWNSKSIGE